MSYASPSTVLKRGVKLLGGPAAASRRLGVTAQAVCFWLSGARKLPLNRAIELERETRGEVTVEQLRPDIDWAVIRGKPTSREAA